MQRRDGLAADDPLLQEAIVAQSKMFSARFGREPAACDPVFFCWHSDTPRPMCDLCFAEYERAIVDAAEKVGMDVATALQIAGVDDPLGTLKTTH